MSMMMDDTNDLASAREGGPQGHVAFAHVYDRHAPVVLALCRRKLPAGDLAEAEDALQETFIRAYRMLERLDDASGFRSWAYAIARNVCAERRRAAGRRKKHEEAAAMNHVQEQRARDHATVPDAVQRSEELTRLDDAILALPERERLAIHLYYLDADPIDAAQAALGLSRSGFYKLLSKARERLGVLMNETSTS